MVINMGKSKDMFHMRGWGLDGFSLHFNHTYILGSCSMPGPGKGCCQEAQVILAQFIPW